VEKISKYDLLTTGAISRVIPQLALPAIIGMVVTSIYNIVDSYYVGLINTQATAAVGVVFPVMAILQAVGFFFGQGSGTYISRQLGAKQDQKAQTMASTALLTALLTGVAITVFGLLFLEPLSKGLGSTPTILPYTKDYLGVILLGAPVMTCSMVLNNQLRFEGNARESMYGMVLGALLNVGLVPLFTFTFGLGILGTAIGTVLSQVAALLVMWYYARRGESVKVSLRGARFEREYMLQIVAGGSPSLSRQGLASVSTLMLNVAAGAYGDAAIAGMSLVTRIVFIIFAVLIGFGHGFQPLCGFCYGAGLYDRVKQGFWFCVKFACVFSVVACVPAFLMSDSLIDLLRHDAAVVAVGGVALRWQLVTTPLGAFVMYSNMMMQTSGSTLSANLLAMMRNGICFIPTLLIMNYLMGLSGVEMSQAIADVLAFLVAIPLTVQFFRSLRKPA